MPLKASKWFNMKNCSNLLSDRSFSGPGARSSSKLLLIQGSLFYQPNQCTIGEIHENHYTFAACLIPPKIGSVYNDIFISMLQISRGLPMDFPSSPAIQRRWMVGAQLSQSDGHSLDVLVVERPGCAWDLMDGLGI